MLLDVKIAISSSRMPRLSLIQRKRALELYSETRNFSAAARFLQQEFPAIRATAELIQYQVIKFDNRFCLHDHHSIASAHVQVRHCTYCFSDSPVAATLIPPALYWTTFPHTMAIPITWPLYLWLFSLGLPQGKGLRSRAFPQPCRNKSCNSSCFRWSAFSCRLPADTAFCLELFSSQAAAVYWHRGTVHWTACCARTLTI